MVTTLLIIICILLIMIFALIRNSFGTVIHNQRAIVEHSNRRLDKILKEIKNVNKKE